MLRSIGGLAAGGVVLWALDRINQAQPSWVPGWALLCSEGSGHPLDLVILSILDASTQPLGRVYPVRASTVNAASTQLS